MNEENDKPVHWCDRLAEALNLAVSVLIVGCGLAIGLAVATGAWRWALTVEGLCV